MFDKVSIKVSSNIFILQLSASSAAALDLAHISQTSPRASFSRTADSREKSSEWPQFSAPRTHDGLLRNDRRAVTNPNLTVSPPHDSGSTSGSPTSHLQQPPQFVHSHTQGPSSHRGSPPGSTEGLSTTTRSVPSTPLGALNNGHHTKTPGTPRTPDPQGMNGRLPPQGPHQLSEHPVNAGDLQASLSRLPPGQYENASLGFNSIQPGMDESIQVSCTGCRCLVSLMW
jgi:hypothetical protein